MDMVRKKESSQSALLRETRGSIITRVPGSSLKLRSSGPSPSEFLEGRPRNLHVLRASQVPLVMS